MLYVQQSLGPDEELVHVGQFHWMYTVGAFMAIIWGLILALAVVAACVIFYLQMGYIPKDVSWIGAVQHIHPGLRLVAFMFFIFGLLRFARKMIYRATTEIAITNKRLVYKRGLIARQVGEISIDRIESVNVLQSVFGRIFDYGRLAVRGMGVGEVVLPPIQNPIAFRQAIERARSL